MIFDQKLVLHSFLFVYNISLVACYPISIMAVVKTRYTVYIDSIDKVYLRTDFLQICGESGRRYTYQQVAFLSRCVASGLAKHGVKKGKVVAILLPNMPEYAFCFFGILAAGGIVTTINPAYTPGV